MNLPARSSAARARRGNLRIGMPCSGNGTAGATRTCVWIARRSLSVAKNHRPATSTPAGRCRVARRKRRSVPGTRSRARGIGGKINRLRDRLVGRHRRHRSVAGVRARNRSLAAAGLPTLVSDRWHSVRCRVGEPAREDRGACRTSGRFHPDLP